jgi:hypothetical protein
MANVGGTYERKRGRKKARLVSRTYDHRQSIPGDEPDREPEAPAETEQGAEPQED